MGALLDSPHAAYISLQYVRWPGIPVIGNFVLHGNARGECVPAAFHKQQMTSMRLRLTLHTHARVYGTLLPISGNIDYRCQDSKIIGELRATLLPRNKALTPSFRKPRASRQKMNRSARRCI
jgi:hypothetical protein